MPFDLREVFSREEGIGRRNRRTEEKECEARHHMGHIFERTQEHEEYSEQEQRAEKTQVIVVCEIVAVFLILCFCFRQRTPIHAPAPTMIPTTTPSPSPSPTPSPTLTPTMTPSPTPTPLPFVEKEVDKGHPFKPWTEYVVYNVKGSQQNKLQKVAKTDKKSGIRVVVDPYGVERYCVALGTYWCGGHPEHIGRCVDMVMENGHILPCVLADVKREEDAKRSRYGKINNDVIEFIVDRKHLPSGVYGDMQRAGEEFEGDVVRMIVYDIWIEGFGK